MGLLFSYHSGIETASLQNGVGRAFDSGKAQHHASDFFMKDKK